MITLDVAAAEKRIRADERERIAMMIEEMPDGPLTTKGVKAYIAASIRNLSCEDE